MAVVVLKERQFEPTGRNLGDFESKDLETFDIQFQEDDVKDSQEGKGNNEGPVSHVPNPIDNNPLNSEDNKKGGNGGLDGPSQNPDLENTNEPEKEEDDSGVPQIPDEWDVMGDNPDDQDYDIPKPRESEDDSSGGGDGGSSVNMPSDNQKDGGDSDSSDNSDGSSGSESGEEEDEPSSDSSQEGDSGNSDSDGNDGEDTNSSSGESQSGGEESDSQNGSGDSSSSDEEDSDSSSQQGQQSDNQNQSDSNSSQNDNSSNNNSKPSNDNSHGGGNEKDSASPQDKEMEYNPGEVDNTKLFDDDDDFDPAGDIQSFSDLEKALDKISEKESDTSKEKRESEAAVEEKDKEDNANNTRKSPTEMRDRAEEAAAAKEILSKAIQDSRDRKANEDNSQLDSTTDSVEDEVLSELGAGKLTTLFNPNTAKDWRVQLDRLFDKATGYDIVTNPNLFNKKIEDAPPGREDFEPTIKNIVVLLDYSGSMGAIKFKEVISHIDTMLKARKLTRTTFHIFPWGTSNVSVLVERYTRCKGSAFKTTINSKFKEGQDSTYLAPVIPLVLKKVHKPDAIIIMTDAEIYDEGNFNRSPMCTRFIKKFRDRIIWALTSDASVNNITKFDPTAKAKKRYVKFKKGGRD